MKAGWIETCRSADDARAAVVWTALESARRLASLNVNGMLSNLLLPARPKKKRPPTSTRRSIRWRPGGHGDQLAVAP